MTTKFPLLASLKQTMIAEVPAYANKFIYSLGFLSMTCFMILIFTGAVMAGFGPDWWLTDSTGQYLRSIHLWATQAFVLFMVLHLLIVFFGSGFKKPRRLTWVFGALMFVFVMAEAEFGYVLRGDFSSQWRSLQGADLYNGAGIGAWLNNLNYKQIYGMHIVVVPLLIIGLLFFHYLRVRALGIAKPYKTEVKVPIVKANHTLLFIRGGVLAGLILVLAIVFPSPFLKSTSVKEIANSDQKLIASTLMKEFDRSSDTSTYSDNIDPYKYDTRVVYIQQPYNALPSSLRTPDQLQKYNSEPLALQTTQLAQAQNFFKNAYPSKPDTGNPIEQTIVSLVSMAEAGAYEPVLNSAEQNSDQTTHSLRFIADTGVLDDRAQALGITTEQYGMLREEKGHLPPGAWWLAPIGLLNHTVLANDDNGDRDGAIILGLFLLVLTALPYIPGLNRLPEVFKIYKLIWRI